MKRKEFDAVKMMRAIRGRLSKRYYNHTDVLMKDLEAIRKKNNIRGALDKKRTSA